MHKLKKSSLILLSLLTLTGCINNIGPKEEKPKVASNQATIDTTNNQLSSQYYRAVIRDGKYKLGASASEDFQLTSAGNTKAFEEGLMRISKSIFPQDQYYLQEGQLIDKKTLTSWLSRESEKNPEGLNPAISEDEKDNQPLLEETTITPAEDPEKIEETEENGQVVVDAQATPIYISEISEKNIMVETKDGFALNGIVIGLAMNSQYTYTDENGVVHTQEISMGELRERGKQYANIIVGRLRNTEELRSVPIAVGIFRNAPNNDIVGGTYVLDGISREGNSVADWTEHNEYRVILPIVDQNLQSEQYAYFDNFRNRVIDFFPNLNGVSAEAFYVDDQLETLNVSIISQFYSNTETTALAQHVTDVAIKELPENADIEIKIESVEGIEAYIGKDKTADKYESHVFY